MLNPNLKHLKIHALILKIQREHVYNQNYSNKPLPQRLGGNFSERVKSCSLELPKHGHYRFQTEPPQQVPNGKKQLVESLQTSVWD